MKLIILLIIIAIYTFTGCDSTYKTEFISEEIIESETEYVNMIV